MLLDHPLQPELISLLIALGARARVVGPKGERGGLVSFAFRDIHAHDVVTFADEDGIALRGGHHCNQPLMKRLGLTSTARASFYVYNEEREIDLLMASMRRALKFFGSAD